MIRGAKAHVSRRKNIDDNKKQPSLADEVSPITKEINEASGFIEELQRLKRSISYNEGRLQAMIVSLEKKDLNAHERFTLSLLRGTYVVLREEVISYYKEVCGKHDSSRYSRRIGCETGW